MKNRSIVILTALVAAAIFVVAALVYQKPQPDEPPIASAITPVLTIPPPAAAQSEGDSFIRPYSPIVGAMDAPVTIVEFLDPSCEACRAFYPHVKEILAAYPGKVRVVVRYAPFHKGSDEAIRILEAARLQGLFEPVLEALFTEQPRWASHHAPKVNKAWEIAATKGLDITRAQSAPSAAEVKALLEQEMADLKTNNVKSTPTFFMNGGQFPSIQPKQLKEIIASEVQRVEADRSNGQSVPAEGETK